MKIAIFFDGQNFYRSLLRYDESLRVDYDRLAAWITQQVGGSNALFSGGYHYIGVSADAPPLVEGFLKGLELHRDFATAIETAEAEAGALHAAAIAKAARDGQWRASAWWLERRSKQFAPHAPSVWGKFDGSVRAVLPLFDREVRGVDMLREAAGKLFE